MHARRKSSTFPPEPSRAVFEALRKLMSERELQALTAVYTVRTAAQRMDHALSEWMTDAAASWARFRILVILWAAQGRGVPHKEIVANLGVTRATVSGLMKGLERDGLVTSAADTDDRRTLLAHPTRKGETVVRKTHEILRKRLDAAFGAFSSDELTTLTRLSRRLQRGFAPSVDSVGEERRDGR